jgi:hypothetical protein
MRLITNKQYRAIKALWVGKYGSERYYFGDRSIQTSASLNCTLTMFFSCYSRYRLSLRPRLMAGRIHEEAKNNSEQN